MVEKKKRIVLSVISIILVILIIAITCIYIVSKQRPNKNIIIVENEFLCDTWNIYQVEKKDNDGKVMTVEYETLSVEIKKDKKINICRFNINIKEFNCKEVEYTYNESNSIIEFSSNETLLNGRFVVSRLSNDTVQLRTLDNNQEAARINLRKTKGI